MTKRLPQRGFTLTEALTASVVLSVAVLAISSAVVSGHMHNGYALHAQRGGRLAEELLEYISSASYFDPQGASTPGPENGEAGRALFDNADDWHGYTEGPGGLTDMSGKAYSPEYQIFRREVQAWYETVSLSGLGSVAGLWVQVTVSDTAGRSWEVKKFIPCPTE